MGDHVEPGGVHPLVDRLAGEPETPVGVIDAQELLVVRREVDDDEPAVRAQHAGGLADRAGCVVEQVEDLMDDDDVERVAGQAERVEVALTHPAVPQPGTVEVGAGDGEHLERLVEAESVLDPRAEELEHPPGAGSEVEHRAVRLAGQGGDDRLLDPLVGDVQAADPVPAGGVPGEVLPRRLRPLGAHRAQPLAVVGDRRVGGVEVGQRPADDASARPDVGEAEERPRPLRRAGHQAGLGEQLEVARDARLRLAQDLGEVRHGELGLGQQRQDPQPGRLPGRLQGLVEGVERQAWGRCGAGRLVPLPYGHKDMFISPSTLKSTAKSRTVCVR